MPVSEQIIQVIDNLCEKFGIAVNWTSENVIPYVETLCRKLITYEIVTSIIWIVVMVSLTIGSVVATKKFYPVIKQGWKDNLRTYDCGWIIIGVFAIIGLSALWILTFGVISTQITDIIKCVVFPEMYVFEYVKALM